MTQNTQLSDEAPTSTLRQNWEPGRFLASGDEAGTAPSDRKFRPDVEGLRAVAILLVLFAHFGIPGFVGGLIGVDVFFVISGFVISGALLRERASTGGTSLLEFYRAEQGASFLWPCSSSSSA